MYTDRNLTFFIRPWGKFKSEYGLIFMPIKYSLTAHYVNL